MLNKEAYERIINEVPTIQPTSSPLEKTASKQIIPLTGEISFITDKKLYQEIIKYLDKTFSQHKDKLSNKLSFNDKDKVMKGSNTYIATAVDMYLKKINSE